MMITFQEGENPRLLKLLDHSSSRNFNSQGCWGIWNTESNRNGWLGQSGGDVEDIMSLLIAEQVTIWSKSD